MTGMQVWCSLLGAFWIGYLWGMVTTEVRSTNDSAVIIPIMVTIGTILFLATRGLLS